MLPEILTNPQVLVFIPEIWAPMTLHSLFLGCPPSPKQKTHSFKFHKKNTLLQLVLRFFITDYKGKAEQKCATLITQETNLTHKVYISSNSEVSFLFLPQDNVQSHIFPNLLSPIFPPLFFFILSFLSKSHFSHFPLCLTYLKHDVLGAANIYYNLTKGSTAILSPIAFLEPVNVGVEV